MMSAWCAGTAAFRFGRERLQVFLATLQGDERAVDEEWTHTGAPGPRVAGRDELL
jgi:hypothetical protein